MAMATKSKEDSRKSEHDGASPGKIFIGGLPRGTSLGKSTLQDGSLKMYNELANVETALKQLQKRK